MLIAFSGLPGTGKTTLARSLAARLGAVYLRIDTIEDALARSVLAIGRAQDAGYVAACGLAADNLANGLAVVVDSVNAIALTRRAFRDVSSAAGVPHLDVEVVCSDRAEHRRRVEARLREPDRRQPTWEAVERRQFEPWAGDRLVVDTARRGADDALALILARISATRGG